MTDAFSRSNKGLGICDRCGQQWQHRRLKFQVVKQKRTPLLVCPDCLDIDHPQLMLGTTPVVDIQALRNPRPDVNLIDSRDIHWGWNPVMGVEASCNVGNVTVVTS